MSIELLYHVRFSPVIVLRGVAAALLRHPDEPPLALKGLRRVLGGGAAAQKPIPRKRRWLAFICVLMALVLALI